MKITIIELDYHLEVLYNTCLLFQNMDYNVHIFIPRNFYEKVNKDGKFDNFIWQLKGNNEATKDFITKNLGTLNKCDVILFNTLASHFKLFSHIELFPPKLLRIHNTNAYLNQGKSFKISFNPYIFYKDISHLLRKSIFSLDWYYRRKFLRKVDYLIFPDERIKEYAQMKGLTKSFNESFTLPLVTYSEKYKKSKLTEEIYVTIPGTIDRRRKDYSALLEAINKIKPNLDKKVILTFLGKRMNILEKPTINKFKKIESNRLALTFFENWVPQEEFDNILHYTDFLLLPLKIDVKYTVYKEFYGYTKISGSINDIIKFGKPAILPKSYPVNKNLDAIIEQYSSADDLAELLLNWVNNSKYKEYEQHINQALEPYSIENVRSQIDSILSQITTQT